MIVVTICEPDKVDVKTTFETWQQLLEWLWTLDWQTYQRITIAVKK